MKKTVVCGFIVVVLASLAMASTFNDKSPLGINLTGVIDHSSEIVFLDHMKRVRPLVSQCNVCKWDQGPAIDVDENGWVKSLKTGQFIDMVLGTKPNFISGQYKVIFDGAGRLEGRFLCSGTVTKSGDIITLNASSTDNAKIAVLSLKQTDPGNYIRNIRVVRVDQLDLYNSGEFLDPTFIDKWRKFRTLRFMDWGATNDSKINTFADMAPANYYTCSTERGVPLETMIAVANKLDCYPWFCIPHRLSDEDVRKYAQKVRSLLKPHLRIYVEHSNEVWNGDFDQSHELSAIALTKKWNLLNNKGKIDTFKTACHYHGSRTARIGQIFKEVFANNDRVVCVLGVGGPREWMAEQGVERAKLEKTAQYIDAVAIAPYVGSGFDYTTEAQAIKILNENLADYRTRAANVKAKCDALGKRMIAYEGGQHLWKFGDKFSEVGETVQGNAGMYPWVKQYHSLWKEVGGNEFVVFASGGGFWGQIPWGMTKENAPKYKGLSEFIDSNPIWWPLPKDTWSGMPVSRSRLIRTTAAEANTRFFTIDGRMLSTKQLPATSLVIEEVGGVARLRMNSPATSLLKR